MTLGNFLSFLQQLITMADPDDRMSVDGAKRALTEVIALAIRSKKVDPLTRRVMGEAEYQFERLLRHKDAFQGVPGEYLDNDIKRHRLMDVLRPGC